MNSDFDRDELFRLCGGLTHETLTAEEHQRLEEMLSASAEARRLWFLHCDMERGLSRWAIAQREAMAAVAAPVVAMPPSRHHLHRPWAWAMAAGITIAAIIASVALLPAVQASPVALVRRALAVHAAALDRCYRIGAHHDSAPRSLAGLPPAGSPGPRLWTRGDRFWIEGRTGDQSSAWGRDEEGRVWFTISPEIGARFDADEVPELFAEFFESRSLQVESLLRSLLADFDLRRETDAAGNYVVHAELKAGHKHPRYRAALLEMDGASGVLRRVEVQRLRGRPPVTVTFTLIETALHDDANYSLQGHLSAQAVIYDRQSAPGIRARLLARFLALAWGQSRDGSPAIPAR